MKQQDYNARPQNFSRPMGPMMNQPMGQPMGRPMNQPMGQPMGRPMNQPMNRPMGQPVMRPMNQPMNRPVMPGTGAAMQGAPMMNGGNFAPRPQNPQMQMNNGMFGAENYQQQDTMPGFEGSYNGEDWNNIQLGDVRDQMSLEQAQANVDHMDQFIEQMQGQVDLGVASSGNIDQVVSAINMLIGLLDNPKGWLPTNTSPKYIDLVVNKGAVIVKNLKIFGNAVAQLK